MKIAIQHYIFLQHYGQGPSLIKKTCGDLANVPLEWCEPSVDPLFEDDGSFRDAAMQEMEDWRAALRKIQKKVASWYFNFPAVQIPFDSAAEAGLARFLKRLKKAFPELETVVTNPVPLDWGDPLKQKSDEQLADQAIKLRRASALARDAGLQLAYHFHAPELVADEREFKAMMNGIPSREMSLALDANWCVMADIDPLPFVREHLDRIALVHLRSSHGKIWDETLEEGEENNPALIRILRESGYSGPWVIELADNGVQSTLPLDERHRRSANTLEGWIG